MAGLLLPFFSKWAAAAILVVFYLLLCRYLCSFYKYIKNICKILQLNQIKPVYLYQKVRGSGSTLTEIHKNMTLDNSIPAYAMISNRNGGAKFQVTVLSVKGKTATVKTQGVTPETFNCRTLSLSNEMISKGKYE
jgi:hypothetical protein